MSATKSALDKLIESTNSHWPTLTPKARAELAQLRADLQAAQERIAEQARQLDEARVIMQHFTGLKVAADRQMAYDWLAAANRIACAVQLYDEWGGHYVVQRIVDGAYVDVRQLERDEAMTYRAASDEVLRLVWEQ